ncbi:MAG TPA: sigma 54-interacting transcriptional regulator [Labilithrix sp.]
MTLPEKTIRDDSGAKAPAEPRRLPYLFVVLECARPLAGGARLRIEGVEEIVIGRAQTRGAAIESADGKKRLVLGVPDARMSTRHASLARTAEGWVLADSGSTNGTFVAGERVDRAVLADGATFDCGGTVFLFRTALPADAGPHLFVDQGSLPHRALGLASLMPSAAAPTSALAKIAVSDAPVLLLGESGTGKEVTARAVHALSKRSGAFVPVNCGALPETLLESQLFGHVKGSFSGAQRDELGLVRASDKGTLFLDEIGDMRAPSQVALLRLLQEREVTPVGATKPVAVDLRVVAATHRPVDALEAGGFRSDLYARVAGYTHRLAPLRDRIADLGLLVSDLLAKLAPDKTFTVGLDLARAMVAYDWPLNVRELEQALRVVSLLAQEGVLGLAEAPEPIREAARRGEEPSAPEPEATPSDDARIRDKLVAALQAHGGNVSRVASDLGKTRMQIHRWMKRFGIDPETYRR